MPYKNIFDCIQKTASREGISGLWVGYPTFYFRIAPHVMITLIMNDFLNDLAKRFWIYILLYEKCLFINKAYINQKV